MSTVARRAGATGVVLGAGVSVEAETARRWALAEARLRGVPLTLLRACGSTPQEATVAVDLVREVASRCAQEAPGVPLRQVVVPGSAVAALSRSGGDLVVVGAPDLRRLDLVRGSVGPAVAARGQVPVVVARGDHGRGEAADWPVVAALRVEADVPDGTLDGDPVTVDAATLELAAEAAQREGRPLVVVNAHQPLPGAVPGGPLPLTRLVAGATADPARARRLRRLRAAARYCQERFPGVRVRVELADDAPDRAVLERTAHAALVVVGVRRLRPGTVGRLLERIPPVLPVGAPLEVVASWRSRCPVLLAPPGAVARARVPTGPVGSSEREERR